MRKMLREREQGRNGEKTARVRAKSRESGTLVGRRCQKLGGGKGSKPRSAFPLHPTPLARPSARRGLERSRKVAQSSRLLRT